MRGVRPPIPIPISFLSAAFLTDYRTSFSLPFREVKAEQHADSGDADGHLEEERGHPESEPYREFAKSERDGLLNDAFPN